MSGTSQVFHPGGHSLKQSLIHLDAWLVELILSPKCNVGRSISCEFDSGQARMTY
jgi:hypothetical protein